MICILKSIKYQWNYRMSNKERYTMGWGPGRFKVSTGCFETEAWLKNRRIHPWLFHSIFKILVSPISFLLFLPTPTHTHTCTRSILIICMCLFLPPSLDSELLHGQHHKIVLSFLYVLSILVPGCMILSVLCRITVLLLVLSSEFSLWLPSNY